MSNFEDMQDSFYEFDHCYNNTLINGTIQTLSVLSVRQCAAWCNFVTLCNAFVYFTGLTWNRTCELKTYTGLLFLCEDDRLGYQQGAKMFIKGGTLATWAMVLKNLELFFADSN